MAAPNDAVYEIRVSTGSDTACSGGFAQSLKGATGVDYSQQAAAQATFTATLSGTGTTTLTDSANGFSNLHLGNAIQITGQGVYWITAFLTAGTVTLDRALGTFSGSTGYIGGAFATLTKFGGLAAAGSFAHAKAEASYLENATFTTTAGTDALPITIQGYTTTRGDGGQITVDAQGARAACVTVNKTFTIFKNIIMTGATTRAVDITATNVVAQFFNCQFLKGSGTATVGIDSSASSNLIAQCTSCFLSGFGTYAALRFSGVFDGCKILNCGPIYAPSFSGNLTIRNCEIQGGSGPGVSVQGNYGNLLIDSNTIYGKTSGSGILFAGTTYSNCRTTNNILAGNAAYGLDAPNSAGIYANGNAYWSNTSGSRNTIPAGANDVVLTGTDPTNDPFTNKASGILTLNNTAGAGATLRGTGFPGSVPSGSSSYRDFGAYQHQDPASGGIKRPSPMNF